MFFRHRLLAVPMLLVSLTGCSLSTNVSVFGQQIVEGEGTITVDGVRLEHARWVTVTGAHHTGVLQLGTATGSIDLRGVPADSYEFEVELWSEIEGDGEVSMEGGRLSSHTLDGRTVFVNAIRGRLPEDAELELSSGTGDVSVADLSGDQDVSISVGTHSVAVTGCSLGSLRIDSGTADMTLRQVSAERIVIDTGTGDLVAEDVRADHLELNGGTSDTQIRDCGFGTLQADTGTGDLRLERSDVRGRLAFNSGTGDLALVDGQIGDLDTDLGTGDVDIVRTSVGVALESH